MQCVADRACEPREVAPDGRARAPPASGRPASPTRTGRRASTPPARAPRTACARLRARACRRCELNATFRRRPTPSAIRRLAPGDAAGLPVRGEGPARLGRSRAVGRARGERALADRAAAASSASGWAPSCSASRRRSGATARGWAATRPSRTLASPRSSRRGRARSRWWWSSRTASWHVDEMFAALRAAGATLCTTELPPEGDEGAEADRTRTREPPIDPADGLVPVPAPATPRLRRRRARRVGGADRAVPRGRRRRLRVLPARPRRVTPASWRWSSESRFALAS